MITTKNIDIVQIENCVDLISFSFHELSKTFQFTR